MKFEFDDLKFDKEQGILSSKESLININFRSLTVLIVAILNIELNDNYTMNFLVPRFGCKFDHGKVRGGGDRKLYEPLKPDSPPQVSDQNSADETDDERTIDDFHFEGFSIPEATGDGIWDKLEEIPLTLIKPESKLGPEDKAIRQNCIIDIAMFTVKGPDGHTEYAVRCESLSPSDW